MRIENANGIILRTRPLTETSLIVSWLTPELGRVATVAKGARRPKSAFHGKLDLFYAASFSFSRSARSELHTLREVVVRDTHEPLRRELGWVQQASYAAALIEQTTETETPLPEIHTLFAGLLSHLPAQPPPRPGPCSNSSTAS
jgi:DNA repair protein RecO (recombination protein O)